MCNNFINTNTNTEIDTPIFYVLYNNSYLDYVNLFPE
jgi:hypothetical protein